jgi:hypothetical protein
MYSIDVGFGEFPASTPKRPPERIYNRCCEEIFGIDHACEVEKQGGPRWRGMEEGEGTTLQATLLAA